MKKTVLLLMIAVSTLAAQAQVTLSGTSYSQNFDALPTIPTGWTMYSYATKTSLGTLQSLQYSGAGGSEPSMLRPDTSCIGSVSVGGFKNYPSATVCHQDDDFCGTTPPSTYTNRAFGVRQVSYTNSTHPGLDSGAAFVLKLNNTTGFSTFNISFKLQSLDTSSTRVTTWVVDYGIGTSPTSFTPITMTGTMTTGGNTFSNNTVTGSFGTALDNLSSPVYIRVVALAPTSGSGNRASSAIDDFSLTYHSTTGVTTVSAQPALSLTMVGMATSEKVTLAYNAEEAGNYTLCIYDLSGRVLHTQSVAAIAGTQSLSVEGLNLAAGMYIAKMSNNSSSSVAKIMVR